MYTIAEVIVISLLVMPMPSNALRGKIQGQCTAAVTTCITAGPASRGGSAAGEPGMHGMGFSDKHTAQHQDIDDGTHIDEARCDCLQVL